MFRFLVDFCLRFRGVVIALACVVLVYGIEVARIILGHATLVTTEIYAEADVTKALDVIQKCG